MTESEGNPAERQTITMDAVGRRGLAYFTAQLEDGWYVVHREGPKWVATPIEPKQRFWWSIKSMVRHLFTGQRSYPVADDEIDDLFKLWRHLDEKGAQRAADAVSRAIVLKRMNQQ